MIKEEYKIQNNYGRLYKIDNKVYPSVTTMLGNYFDNSWIEEWKARVGEEEVKRVSKRATTHGTLIHSITEEYLNGNELPNNINPIAKIIFNKTKPFLNRITNIFCQEEILFSHKLRVAGRIDCAADFDGVNSIIDFKTTKEFKSEKDIESYFIQTAMYSLMLYETFGLQYKKLVIIFFNESGNSFYHEGNIKDWYKEAFKVSKHFYKKHSNYKDNLIDY